MDKSLISLGVENSVEKRLAALTKKLDDLDLLLEAEELFEARYAELQKEQADNLEIDPGYSPTRFQVYICNEFNYGNTREGLEKASRFMQLVKGSMTTKEMIEFKNTPFNIYPYSGGPEDGDVYSLNNEEKNFHKAIWLDFMILVLEDEVLELLEDESLPEEVPGVPEDMPVPKGLS